MKTIIVLFLVTLWLAPELSQAQSVTIGVIPASSFCGGDSVSVKFTVTGFFGHKNAFTLQLSDATGSFASGFTNLASITDTLPGTFTIAAAIPRMTSSLHYRFRILAAVPYMTSADNGSDITTSTVPYFTLNARTPSIFDPDVVQAGVTAQFNLSPSKFVVDSIFWNFGPDATPSTAIGGLSPKVIYSTGGNKAGSVRLVAPGGCSRTSPFSEYVFDCNPSIPHYAKVIDSSGDDFSRNAVLWVNPGVVLGLQGTQDTVFAEPGSILGGC